MRIDVLLGSLLLATACAPAARAGSGGCCSDAQALPRIVYVLQPVPFAIPPTGYALNPSDAARPFYLVNQGPSVPGLGTVPVARPTYSEGGYAFADAYPYDYPYVVSRGFGLRYRYRAFRSAPRVFHGDPSARPFGTPYAAFR
jgi:hypothetical protein